MEAWAAFLASLLDLGLRLLEKADAARAAEFRRRCAADPSGVLLEQLNPGTPSSASSGKSATCKSGRKSGAVDE